MSQALASERISVETGTIEEARSTMSGNDFSTSELVLLEPDGSQNPLPEGLQSVLRSVLESLAQHGGVTIGHIPEELSSTVAADTLGVSRPTLLKWAKDGIIDSHKVGTHTRFHREDVLALRGARRQAQRRTLDELRALDDEFA